MSWLHTTPDRAPIVVSQHMPPELRNRLVQASKTGQPESIERQQAIDDAITYATTHFPDLFKRQE